MDVLLVSLCLVAVIILYFKNNPMRHSRAFMIRRFVNWFPLGMSYAFLYMARYNLNVSKNALGDMMTKEQFGIIFAAGTVTYAVSFLINGPLVDKIGGKKGILIATLGASFANFLMGGVTYLYVMGQLKGNMLWPFCILYAVNMFFQSYGAVSIIKVKAYWFHVRERGVFGAIFGTLISFGVYFAFDWGQSVADAAKIHPDKPLNFFQQAIQTIFAVGSGSNKVDAIWLVFIVPAIILIFWALIDLWLIKDTPREANFADFDPADASSNDDSNDDDVPITIGFLLKKIFTSPIMYTIAFIDFTAGVIRNGVMQWYMIFAKEIGAHDAVFAAGSRFFVENWGLLLCLTGIFGSFAAGLISDRFFQSRRGPPAALMSGIMVVLTSVMAVFIFKSAVVVGICAILISFAVIGVHGLMSGTAASDFGGRKMTATASGIVDGCVYLGGGLQSLSLGYLTGISWAFWPVFLIPFALLGLIFSVKIWRELPEATKKYILKMEKEEAQALRHES